ncbi:mediator of RNA polymerase II transcription subunit 25-like [Cornus florida]|uniref:mediator of RNA polymerase II transcription subunit 25-like n=1 Tax=Cornus florida TaxID=4283 RepID=UPI0028A127CA|nr:mediator of RNA polymerase II transcription subunit 25-like [Cornus florida]
MAEKRLLLVVDGTVEMAPHWSTILRDYIEKITRYFCGNVSASQDNSATRPAFAVVVYGAHGPYNATESGPWCNSKVASLQLGSSKFETENHLSACKECLVQASSWTRDMNKFLQWLSALSFEGGGNDEAGIAEGLSNALMMFQANTNENQTQQFGQRHCILVAASNPCLFPTPVQLPIIQVTASGKITDARMECDLADTETVARSFIQSFVSLSVLSPKKFAQLKAIYSAGNCSHQTTESSVNDIKNPHHLVLISENFVEARAALNQLESKSTPDSILETQTETGSHLSLPESFKDEDIMMQWKVFSEPFTRQHDILAENIPATPVQPKREKEKVDDEEVSIFQEILNELEMDEEETPSGSIPTGTAQQKRGKEKMENDDIMTLWETLSESLTSKQEIPAKDFPTAAEKLEPYVVKPKELGTAFPHHSNDLHSTFKSMSSVKTSSDFFTSQLKSGFEDIKVKLTPAGIVMSQKGHNGSQAAVNASFSSNLLPPLQVRTSSVKNGGSSPEPQTIGRRSKYPHQTMWSPTIKSEATLISQQNAEFATNGSTASAASTISGNLKISHFEGLRTMSSFTQTMPLIVKSESRVKTKKCDQKTSNGSLITATSDIYGNLKTSKLSANLQGPISTGQSLLLPNMNSGHFTRVQVAQDEYWLKRKHINAFGQPSISYGADTSISMVGKSQRVQEGMDSVTVSNTLSCKTRSQQTTSTLSGPPKGYIEAWEGDLTSKENGQTVFLSRLVRTMNHV